MHRDLGLLGGQIRLSRQYLHSLLAGSLPDKCRLQDFQLQHRKLASSMQFQCTLNAELAESAQP